MGMSDMRKLTRTGFFIVLALGLLCVPAHASFTSVGRNTNSSVANNVTIATGAPIAGVQAGDVVFAIAAGDTSTVINKINDGSADLTCLAGVSTGSTNGRMCYTLSSTAVGSVTYTATFSGNDTDKFIGAWVFHPSAAATFDQSAMLADTDATWDSGSITTTGSDEMVFGCGFTGNGSGAPTSMNIGGAAATDTDTDGRGGIWYKAATGTISASASSASSTRGVIGIMSVKISGGAVVSPSLTTLGAGQQ